MNSIKFKIPTFQGRNDPDAYLEWERKIELIFACHNYSEEKKVKLVVVEFSRYASIWWNQLTINRRRNLERPISTWQELRQIMRKRYIPSHYYRDLFRQLQVLTQGNRSVEEYYMEMETLLMKVDLKEEDEVIMARFLNGLNRDIADKVELQHYMDLDEMYQMALKFEG